MEVRTILAYTIMLYSVKEDAMKKGRTYHCNDGCPVSATLDVIGGKWKGVILYHLLRQPTLRFNELNRLLPTVTPRMLTRQLRELEEDGVIHRQVYPQIPPKVEYSLTEFGQSLEPIIELMEQWGTQYVTQVVAHRVAGAA